MSIENPSFILVDPSVWEVDDIGKFIQDQQAVKTKYATKYGCNTFMKYCKTINEQRTPEMIPANLLNTILCQFFIRENSINQPSSINWWI